MSELPIPSTLADLVNEAVFLSTETQLHFEKVVRDRADDWDVDFSDNPHLTFGSGDSAFRVAPHLIGSRDANFSSWRWGWSPDNDWNGPVVDLAHELHKRTVTMGVDELKNAEFDATDDDALRLTLAAKRITGHWAHFPLPVGATTVWLLVDSQDLLLPEPTIRSVVKALASGLTLTEVTDHLAAVEAYSKLRGFGFVQMESAEDGVTAARILTADGYADAEFDSHRRLTKCQVHQPLGGEAAEQLSALGTLAPTPIDFTVTGGPQVPASTPAAAPAEEPAGAAPVDLEAIEPDTSGVEDEQATAAEVAATTAPAPTSGAEESAAPSVEAEAAPATEPPVDSDAPAEPVPTPSKPTPSAEPVEPAQPTDTEQPEAPAEAAEPADAQKQPEKKKGFFRKLFGR